MPRPKVTESKPANVQALIQALRRGYTPEQIAGLKELESGAQKTAYSYSDNWGEYVVKENTGGWVNSEQKRAPNLKRYGCDTIRQWFAKDYIVQEYVTPLRMRNAEWNEYLVPKKHPAWNVFREVRTHERGDYHEANFGIRKDGTLVCFDW